MVLMAVLEMFYGPSLLASQTTAHTDSGSRVRITMAKPSKQRHLGTLVSLDQDSVRFLDSSGVNAVPVTSVGRLELSRGRRSNAGKGAIIGGVTAGALGLILGLAASTEDDAFVEIGTGEIAAVTVILGAGGAGIGALIGATSKSEHWEPVALTSDFGILEHAVPALR